MRYIRGLTAATVVVLLESDMCSAQLRLNLLALTSVQFSAAAIVELVARAIVRVGRQLKM
jgi:hypothetical protein